MELLGTAIFSKIRLAFACFESDRLIYIFCWFSFGLHNVSSLVSFAGKETLRCLVLALKIMPMGQQTLSIDDEKDLTFIGLVCFLFMIDCLSLLFCA